MIVFVKMWGFFNEKCKEKHWMILSAQNFEKNEIIE